MKRIALSACIFGVVMAGAAYASKSWRRLHPFLFWANWSQSVDTLRAGWADHRKVPQIAFKPDWTKHAKAAPFKRNDQMLDVLPIGVLVFTGTGIQENLADKARKLGIPVWKFGNSGA